MFSINVIRDQAGDNNSLIVVTSHDRVFIDMIDVIDVNRVNQPAVVCRQFNSKPPSVATPLVRYPLRSHWPLSQSRAAAVQ